MDKEFDIIVFGATGFTGSLISEYLIKHYGNNCRIALAGRSEDKLKALALGFEGDVPLVIGDAADLDAMRSIAGRTRLIVACTGPFILYGSNMVQACAELGTDYVDVTGEVYWSDLMLKEHEQAAKDSGARIISFCGFDSVPSDLGVYLLQKKAVARYGQPFERVKMRVLDLRGAGALGGSIATMKATMARAASEQDIPAFMADPYGLCPARPDVEQPNGRKPRFDEELNSWAAPFLMQDINTKIVHRTNWQLGYPYGTSFRYDEMCSTGPGEEGKANIERSIKTSSGFEIEEGAADAAPGEGPARELQEAGYYSISFYGIENGQVKAEVNVADDCDPGCASTSKLVGESAICLLQDDVTVAGGFWTPVAAMAEPLYARLQAKQTLQFTERFNEA